VLPIAPEPPPLLTGALPNPAISTATSPIARRVKRRHRRSGGWWIPLLGGLILFGGLGWYVGQDLFPKPLRGELIGEVLDEVELPPVLVSLDASPMPNRQLEPLLSALESEPIPLLSDLMQVQIRGAESGLSISVQAGPKTRWYRIDAHSHPALAEYVKTRAAELDPPRLAAVNAAVVEFLEQYVRIREGKAPDTTVTAFRDQLALNALVKGLGYHVAATFGGRIYPCVAETDDGHLYFLLPQDPKQFAIIGRKHGDGPPKFPGEFTVIVQPGKSAADTDTPANLMPEN
jgi:hypothetical protein